MVEPVCISDRIQTRRPIEIIPLFLINIQRWTFVAAGIDNIIGKNYVPDNLSLFLITNTGGARLVKPGKINVVAGSIDTF